MPRFLNVQDVAFLEEQINLTLEEIDGRDYRYKLLSDAYNSFEPASNSAATLAGVANAVALVNAARANRIRGLISVKIRQTNYPSNWDNPSKQQRALYLAAHPGTSHALWQCPGQGLTLAHDASINDITIDHVVFVAAHWNHIGHDTDRISRQTWYWDTTNHAYLCQSCNSGRGSAGLLYNIMTGLNYSN
jgi:5-methylcytosine-specific restriction endonuclease McrA